MALLLETNGKIVNKAKDEDIARYLYEIAQNKITEKDVEKWILELIE